MGHFKQYRWLLAALFVGIGVIVVIQGARLELRNPRSNAEDETALSVLAIGAIVVGAGVGMPTWRPAIVIVSALALPVVGWCLLVSCYWLALLQSRWPSQEQMVPSGYALIPEARQIDDLLGPALHELSNYTEPDTADWITEVLFDGRYELTMSVRVRVNRSSGDVTEIVGNRKFWLYEISSIRDGREASFSGAGQREFGVGEWQRIVKAGGDFSAIGIKLDRGHPVSGFESYRAVFSNGIQMRR